MENLRIKAPAFILSITLFVFFSFLPGARALVYCISSGPGTACDSATAATCTGATQCGVCSLGTNRVVCGSISDVFSCITEFADENAEIRIGIGSYAGPGADGAITNLIVLPQTIAIKGGYTDPECTAQLGIPTDTVLNAPSGQRVFEIANLADTPLSVRLDTLSVHGGAPSADATCGTIPGTGGLGGNICITSFGGEVDFTSFRVHYSGGSSEVAGGAIALFTLNDGGAITYSSTEDNFGGNSVGGNGVGGGAIYGRCGLTGPEAPPLRFDFTQAIILGNGCGGELCKGGGIYLEAGAQCTIDADMQGGSISDNTAGKGGGLAIEAGRSTSIQVRVSEGTEFVSNSSTGTVSGSGGGAIYLSALDEASQLSLQLAQCSIQQNKAERDGGAILFSQTSRGTVNATLSQSFIHANETTRGVGGAIAVLSSGTVNLDLTNNQAYNNTAQAEAPLVDTPGGGLLAAITLGDSSVLRIRSTNNTYVDNQATCATCTGGGFLYDSSAGGTIGAPHLNDIIFFNESPNAGEEIEIGSVGNTTVSIRFSDIENEEGDLDPSDVGTGVGKINLGEGLLTVDPQFFDHSRRDYRIGSSSPVANAGTKTSKATVAGVEISPPSVDILGRPRDISMGAREPDPASPPGGAEPPPPPTPQPSPIIVERGGDCSIAGPVTLGAGGVTGALLPLLPAVALGLKRLLRKKKGHS